jgi:WD40 repeat protein
VSDDDQILRRHFVAIATGTYEASGTFAALDVDEEVAAMRRWLADAALGGRRFDDHEYAALAHNPKLEQIKDMLRKRQRFTDADAVVVYVTGHGITDADNSHLIVLQETDPQDPADALRTADLIMWLARHQGLKQAMIIIDVCQAGQLDNNLPATLKRDLPPGWLVILAAPAGVDAKLGAFSGAVESSMDELRRASDATGLTEPYLDWYDQFYVPVVKRLRARNLQRPMVITFPEEPPSVYLPNPSFDASRLDRVVTNRARRDLAILTQDMTAHWVIRAPVMAEGGPVFTGRARLMQHLIAFTEGPPATLIVTGRAGCGKSAALARLVTCSDPEFRAVHADALAVAQPVPPEDAVDVAILATGKTSEQIAQQLGRALGIDGPPLDAKTALEGWVETIVDTAEAAERTHTVVIDALDEASDPGAVLTTLLTRLNSPERQRLRLLVGVRSSGGPNMPGEGARDLASDAIMALKASQIRVDRDEFWDPHDLAEYVEQLLLQPGSPYQDGDAAVPVAAAVAKQAERSYLVAGFTARALAEWNEPLTADDPRLSTLLAEGATALVSRDLRASMPDAEDRRRAIHLLRASALAEGRGVPVRTIWPLIASAVADEMSFGDRDVAWLLSGRLSGYLVHDTEDGLTVYRPFHDELRRVLREGKSLDVGSAGDDLADEAEAQRRIMFALLPLAGMTMLPTRRPPHPYARRQLAVHAAAGGRLDDVLNLETLPYLDEVRLSTLLRLTEPAPLSSQWLLLSAFRSIRRRWSWDDPDANAAALDVAHLAVDAMTPLPDRWSASGLTWKPRLAEWQSGGTIVAGDARGALRLAIGTVEGVPTLVTGDESSVRLWDPATGQPLGERLYAPSTIRALALAGGPRLVLAACDGGHVITWDAVSHQPGAVFEAFDLMPTALAVGEVEGRWLLAVGGAGGTVQVQWFEGGALVNEFRDDRRVRAVALAKNEDGRLYLAIAYGDLGQGRIAILDAISGEPRHPGIPVLGEIDDVTLALMGNQLVVAAAVENRAATWDALSGAPISPSLMSFEALSSVALATIGWRHLLATGSSDRTARLWDAFNGQPAEAPLPHPAPVRSVAFGEVDGRTMLVTGCLDGNTRLWDPLRASAARVAVEGWFASLAMDPDVVVAGGEHGQVRQWDIASGASYSALPIGAEYEPAATVRLGGSAPRLLLVQHHDRIAIWDLTNPLQPDLRRQVEIGTTRGVGVHVASGMPRLATLDNADEVRVLDPLAGMTLFGRRIPGALSLRFIDAPDHPLLAVEARSEIAVRGGRLHLLDVESGEPVGDPLPVALPPHAAVGRLDGADVLAALDERGLRFYDLRTGDMTMPAVEFLSTASGIAWGRVGDRDVVLTAHYATVRVWNPRTGRKITELRFGTQIGAMSVLQIDDDRLRVAVSGPGLVVTELRGISS